MPRSVSRVHEDGPSKLTVAGMLAASQKDVVAREDNLNNLKKRF